MAGAGDSRQYSDPSCPRYTDPSWPAPQQGPGTGSCAAARGPAGDVNAARRRSSQSWYSSLADNTHTAAAAAVFRYSDYRDMPHPTMMTLVMMMLSLSTVTAMRTHFVYWNSTNPLFRLDNTDHIVDVNTDNLPWEYDQLHLVCPQHTQEQHVVYSVSEEEFRSCRVTSPRPKIVAICNKPESFMYFTITFRSFSPTPGGLEFKPGQNYYLISTSTQRDIHRRAGGFCSSHNMKMIFKVADNQVTSNAVSSEAEEEEERATSPFLRAVKKTAPPTYAPAPAPSSSSIPIYYYRSRTPTQEPKEYNYYYSPRDLFKLRKAILERTEENETLKAEKLRSSSASLSSLSSISLMISLAFSLCLFHLG